MQGVHKVNGQGTGQQIDTNTFVLMQHQSDCHHKGEQIHENTAYWTGHKLNPSQTAEHWKVQGLKADEKYVPHLVSLKVLQKR